MHPESKKAAVCSGQPPQESQTPADAHHTQVQAEASRRGHQLVFIMHLWAFELVAKLLNFGARDGQAHAQQLLRILEDAEGLRHDGQEGAGGLPHCPPQAVLGRAQASILRLVPPKPGLRHDCEDSHPADRQRVKHPHSAGDESVCRRTPKGVLELPRPCRHARVASAFRVLAACLLQLAEQWAEVTAPQPVHFEAQAQLAEEADEGRPREQGRPRGQCS